MQIKNEELAIIQDALWSKIKKYGQITKKDSAAMIIIGKIAERADE